MSKYMKYSDRVLKFQWTDLEKGRVPVALVLFAFWLILNGKITLEIVLIGLVLSGAICALMHILFGYSPKEDLRNVKKLPLLIRYFMVLLWEIIKANFAVIGVILKGNKAVEPYLVSFDSGLKHDFTRFLLANSITLTPGTITVEVKDDTFYVHCLRRDLLDFSEDSTFLSLLRKLEE